MRLSPALWSSPVAHLKAEAPDQPMLYFAPATLQATAARFLAGFPGLVTYAVKANDADVVLENLAQAGLDGRAREAEPLGERRDGQAGVLGEQLEQIAVHIIHIDRYLRRYHEEYR